MSNINKAVLKIAQSNPEFRKALTAELSKEATAPVFGDLGTVRFGPKGDQAEMWLSVPLSSKSNVYMKELVTAQVSLKAAVTALGRNLHKLKAELGYTGTILVDLRGAKVEVALRVDDNADPRDRLGQNELAKSVIPDALYRSGIKRGRGR